MYVTAEDSGGYESEVLQIDDSPTRTTTNQMAAAKPTKAISNAKAGAALRFDFGAARPLRHKHRLQLWESKLPFRLGTCSRCKCQYVYVRPD